MDEGQDFSEEDWLLAESCGGKEGKLWAFADEAQAFWPDRTMPEDISRSFFKFRLQRPYRCHPAIQHLSDCYAGRCERDPGLLKSAAEEGVIRVITSSEARLQKQIGKEINRLLSERLRPEQIAVLSLRGRAESQSVVHAPKLGDHVPVPATDPEAGSRLVCDTFLRFKGLERPAVIVTDLRLVGGQYEKRMHIAVSRAVSLLRIVGAEREIRNDSLLRDMA